MIPRHVRPLVLVAVGVALLASAVVLYPTGVPDAETYTVRAERPDDLRTAILDADTQMVRYCELEAGQLEQRACALESLVGTSGTVRLANRSHDPPSGSESGLDASYEYVYVAEKGFYEPHSTGDNGSTSVSLRPASVQSVADRVAWRDSAFVPQGVQRAVDSGSATATVRRYLPGPRQDVRSESYRQFVERQRTLVESGGSYYLVTATVTSGPPLPRPALVALRLGLALVGLALIRRATAWQRVLVDGR